MRHYPLVLHVTNGDSARFGIEAAEIGGHVLAWRDTLHEGPVPDGFDAAGLRAVRARFLAGCGWGEVETLESELAERDAALDAALADDDIALWFEHDLYDQLQLVQVLERTGDRDGVLLIQADEFLGPLVPAELARWWPARSQVTAEQAAHARRAWAAFRSPDPAAIPGLLDEGDLHALPYVAPALRRLLEERPDGNCLARSERAALQVLAERPARARELFHATQAAEEAAFFGDTWFYRRLAELGMGDRPLLAGTGGGALPPPPPMPGSDGFAERLLRITPNGRAVLEGQASRIALLGIDRWTGGVHVRRPPNAA